MKDKITTAVGVVIINSEKKLLIAKRKSDKPMPNKWEFPGGKLEKSESLSDCGIREIKEELDIDIKIDEYLGFEDLKYKEKKFCLHFYTAYKIDELQSVKLYEHLEYKWVDISELIKYDFPAIDLSVINKLKRYIQIL